MRAWEVERRLADWEPWLGAVVSMVPGAALGEPAPGGGSLRGMAAGVKDLLWVRGVPRLCGAPGLVDTAPAERDAEAVRRVRAAGASIVTTLQIHQFAFGVVTPQTRNPRAPSRVAGGSSGGAAAAIAAGLVDVAIGTDTGGSIRIPASCCGVVGLKPTFGAVPVDGVQPLAPSLDTVGALALDVAGVARLTSVLTGETVRVKTPTAMRVGVVEELTEQRIDPPVRRLWLERLEGLRGLGVTVTNVRVPSLTEAARANGIVLLSEALAVHDPLLRSQPDGGWWPDLRERFARARLIGPDDCRAAEQTRERLRTELEHVFEVVDVLVLPTLPCLPPARGAATVDINGRREQVTPALTRLTSPWNLAGVPAGSAPAGDIAGVPVGLQVVGRWHGEDAVLAAMALLEEVVGPARVADRADTVGH